MDKVLDTGCSLLTEKLLFGNTEESSMEKKNILTTLGGHKGMHATQEGPHAEKV